MFVGIREGGWLAFPVWRKTTTASIINVNVEPEGEKRRCPRRPKCSTTTDGDVGSIVVVEAVLGG
jgi:hypothetical protein